MKCVFACIFAKFKYFVKQFVLNEWKLEVGRGEGGGGIVRNLQIKWHMV